MNKPVNSNVKSEGEKGSAKRIGQALLTLTSEHANTSSEIEVYDSAAADTIIVVASGASRRDLMEELEDGAKRTGSSLKETGRYRA